MVKVRIAVIGGKDPELGIGRVSDWKSSIFKVVDIDYFFLNAMSDIPTWGFSDENLSQNLPRKEQFKKDAESDIIIYVMDVPLQSNYYSRILDNNRIVVTYYEIREILREQKIPLENYLVRLIYAYSLLFMIKTGKTLTMVDEQLMAHDARRGCLFDMCGIKKEISASCLSPQICGECYGKLLKKNVPEDTLKSVNRELKKLKRGLFYSIEVFLKQHPILSILISFLAATVSSIFASLIMKFFKWFSQLTGLLVLVCGLMTVNVYAQTKTPVKRTTKVHNRTSSAKTTQKSTKEYKVGNDGFEWYLVCKNGKYGAESREGRMLIPYEYERIWYDSKDTEFHAFNNYACLYSREGKCIIPAARHYYGAISKLETAFTGVYYSCCKERDETGILNNAICDATGKEIIYLKDAVSINPNLEEGIFYYRFMEKNGNRGIADANGKIIVQPREEFVVLHKDGYFYYLKEWTENGFSYANKIIVANTSSMSTTHNPFTGNIQIINSSKNTSSSGNNSSSSSSGSGTTAIHVDHHDPVPVQQWQACFACGGMGTMGCTNCGGSGTKYIGDRLHRCSRCNGRGIIPCNICYGNKGQYVTVYK